MTDSVALLQARLHKLLAGPQPENPHNLQVTKDWRRFRRAQERRDRAGMMAAAERIDMIIEQPNDYAVWAQVTPLLSQIAALVAQE